MSNNSNSKTKSSDQVISNTQDSQNKILKNLARKMSDDYFNKKNFPSRTMKTDAEIEVQDINQFIRRSSDKIAGREDDQEYEENQSSFSPNEFDGISSPNEERTLLKEQIKHVERENLKLKHQLDLLKTDYETEKKHLTTTIRDLKSELHRTAPLTDNKFFTFSKDIREVANAVKSLSEVEVEEMPGSADNDMNFDTAMPPSVEFDSPLGNKSANPSQNRTSRVVESPNASHSSDNKTTIQTEPEKAKNITTDSKKASKNTKKNITIATVVAILVFGVSTVFISQKPKVNQDIVSAYLDNTGQVQGTSDQSAETVEPTPSLVRKEFKNNEVSFEETQWETFRDEFLGFQVKYPGNATDLLHTGNTITFLRKEGYLFKMQRIMTEDSAEEYWEKTKTDGLEYEAEPVTIASKPGLHLILKEETEFPGNRYLIKVGDHIFDIWYLAETDKFGEDDMKRVEFMVNSMRFL